MIIGISGKAGSGKDTFASYLLELLPGFERRKFADKLKQVSALLTLCGDQHSAAGKAKYLPQWGMTVGQFQQRLGTDAVRNHLHRDAWVIAALADYHAVSKWIFTDVRFPNEAEAVRDAGGVLVRLNRRDSSQLAGRDPMHESETGLDQWSDWDFVFDNDGSLALLREFAGMVATAARAKMEGGR